MLLLQIRRRVKTEKQLAQYPTFCHAYEKSSENVCAYAALLHEYEDAHESSLP